MSPLALRLPLCAISILLSGCAAAKTNQQEINMSASEGPPIACTLTAEQLNEQRDVLLPGLIERADETSELENGLRLHFASTPGLLLEIARVIERERTCCSFLRFRLDAPPSGGAIILDITGPPGVTKLLRGL